MRCRALLPVSACFTGGRGRASGTPPLTPASALGDHALRYPSGGCGLVGTAIYGFIVLSFRVRGLQPKERTKSMNRVYVLIAAQRSKPQEKSRFARRNHNYHYHYACNHNALRHWTSWSCILREFFRAGKPPIRRSLEMVFLHQESWVQKRSNHCLLDLANWPEKSGVFFDLVKGKFELITLGSERIERLSLFEFRRRVTVAPRMRRLTLPPSGSPLDEFCYWQAGAPPGTGTPASRKFHRKTEGQRTRNSVSSNAK